MVINFVTTGIRAAVSIHVTHMHGGIKLLIFEMEEPKQTKQITVQMITTEPKPTVQQLDTWIQKAYSKINNPCSSRQVRSHWKKKLTNFEADRKKHFDDNDTTTR
mmetsp:Transcript_12834/g.18861  ORF Transcript_12834/g.18861 Transcript_12834/m.18861 type:complete len:105 (-) Transcript_12834:42-356(-)